MTNSGILSQYELRSLTYLQRVGFGVSITLFLGWWTGFLSLPVMVLGAVTAGLGVVRWRGESVLELSVRAARFYVRSRFSAVESSIQGDYFVISCRGRHASRVWHSEHRGRLDLRDEEQSQWVTFLRQAEAASQRGSLTEFSYHVRGSHMWVATDGFDLVSPWVSDANAMNVDMPRWIFESWRDVQSPDCFYRTFEVRNFQISGENLVDAVNDRDGRWSFHAHFFPSSRVRALRRSRRDRHAADAAMSWQGLRGTSSPATLHTLRAIRHRHEEHVARGAALIDFRLSIVVRGASRQELEDACAALRRRVERHGISIHVTKGDQARALVASWPGVSQ